MHDIGGMGKSLLFGIDDKIDIALPPPGNLLGPVLPGLREAKRGEQRREAGGGVVVHGELQEFDIQATGPWRQAGAARDFRLAAVLYPVEQVDERALAVYGDRARRPGPELVVEDFQRHHPVIAGREDRLGEVGDGQIALSRHRPEMPAPGQQVHVQPRRVGELDEEYPVLRNRADAVHRNIARQCMKAVENEPDIGMVGTAHDFPGTAVVADMPAPGQGFVADAQPAFGRPFAEFVKIRRRPVDAAKRERRDVGADQHQVGSQVLHHVELALGPIETALALRLGHAFEIAEGLEQRDLKPDAGDHPADFAGAGVERQEVVLEYLDAIEPGGGYGLQLAPQIAAQRHRGYRGLHRHRAPVTGAGQGRSIHRASRVARGGEFAMISR